MDKGLLLIGGGGHCKVVIDVLNRNREYSRVGIIDNNFIDKSILGVSWIGRDEDLSMLRERGYEYAFVTLGSIGNPAKREKLFDHIKLLGYSIPSIVSKSAFIGGEVSIGEGTFISNRAVINAGSSIGKCVIINTGAIIEHDCLVGDFAHVSPGSILCGEVRIGENTHIGAGSIVKQGLSIGSNTIIGMGSTVTKDIGEKIIAYGNPCKVIEERKYTNG